MANASRASWMGALILLCAAAGARAELVIHRVFGPELPGKYKHPAAIEELDNGDLYLAYYGGGGEYELDTAVYGSRLKKGADKWEAPKAIADTPFMSDGNPVVWQAPDGMVWLFYVNRFGETWSTSRIKAKISTDGAMTWSDSMMVTLEEGTMVRNQPIVLESGKWILPIYHETGHDTELTGSDSTSRFLEHDPKTHKWNPTGIIRHKKGNIQPGIVEVGPDHLIAYCRRGGNYEPTTSGYMVRAESRDGGKTWTEGVDSPFLNPNAAIEFLKLRSGNLLLVYNDSMNERNPLTAAISMDKDKTWPHKREIIRAEGGDFAYPYAIQARDGKIHLIFTSEERTVINHTVFTEDDITGVKR